MQVGAIAQENLCGGLDRGSGLAPECSWLEHSPRQMMVRQAVPSQARRLLPV